MAGLVRSEISEVRYRRDSTSGANAEDCAARQRAGQALPRPESVRTIRMGECNSPLRGDMGELSSLTRRSLGGGGSPLREGPLTGSTREPLRNLVVSEGGLHFSE